MGKLGKNRKRRRQAAELQATAKLQRLSPHSAELALGAKPLMDLGGLDAAEVAATVRTLHALAERPALLKSKAFKQVRAALHPLAGVLGIAGRSAPASLSSIVTSAMEDGRWEDAISALDGMRASGTPLALGALQRWVHMCALDTISAYDPVALRVLYAIIRASSVGDVEGTAQAPPAGGRDSMQGRLLKHEPWAAVPRQCARGCTAAAAAVRDASAEAADSAAAVAARAVAARVKGKFRVVAHETAAERRPPNRHDLDIFASEAGVVCFGPDPEVRHSLVPGVPGAFAMANVLTHAECLQFVAAAEAVGYVPDEPLNSGGGGATRASTFAWLADSSIMDTLLRRCAPHLPAELGGGKLAGINARLRLYRYCAGNIYGPHIDGAWPGSGEVDGCYQYDAYGDRWSRLTFLLYLNDDFEGGGTTYFTADAEQGLLHAHAVAPRAGCVICFPHGDAEGALVHEGSLVTSGFKYIVRTDVLYMVPAEFQQATSKLFARHVRTNKLQDEQRAVGGD